MSRTAKLVSLGFLAAWLAIPTTGCGTIASRIDHNPDWDQSLYSGAAFDLEWVELVVGEDGNELAFLLLSPLWLPAMVDLPFSLVADTVMLPWTIPEQFSQSRKDLEGFVRAVEGGNVELAKTRLEGKPELLRSKAEGGGTPLHIAVKAEQLEMVDWLASQTAGDNAKDAKGRTPLVLALLADRVDLARILLDRGADPNHAAAGWTPLHWASTQNDPALAELLLDRGVPVDVRDGRQETPLHLAAERDLASVVSLLISRGADVNARERGSLTALHRAARKGHMAVAQLLLNHGADVNARTHAEDGSRTPLGYALRSKKTELAEFLRSQGGIE